LPIVIKYNYHHNGLRQKAYNDVIKEYFNKGNVLHDKLDSLKRLSLPDGPEIFDLSTISADYLIRDIELACETFNKCIWKENISLSTFCNYVLPYRTKHEIIENWRKSILDSSQVIHDSSFFQQDISISAGQKRSRELFTMAAKSY
jgi:hypothetical protein